jgi:hypothetical protein
MPRRSRAAAFVVAVVLALLVLAGLAGSARAVPGSGPAAEAYIQLYSTRDALAIEASAYPYPFPRAYIDRAIYLLYDALLPEHWTSTGLALNDAGLAALTEVRLAAEWLVWADPGLRDATASDQQNVVWAMGEIARSRLDEVFHFVGEGNSPDPWLLWASEYLLRYGDALSLDDGMQASLYYISAWQYLLGQPPCC